MELAGQKKFQEAEPLLVEGYSGMGEEKVSGTFLFLLPSPTIKFTSRDETIQAIDGHFFWVSGRGWGKARELAAEQPLRTAIGVSRVTSMERTEPAPTCNLVVADFHTYFVGKSAILSHDVLPPKPTNKVVPGLTDE